MTLDHETYQRVHGALLQASIQGWDPGETLDRQKLLLSPKRQRDIETKTLADLLVMLGTWRPAELLRRKYHPGHQSSPQDMYVVMMEFIEDHLNHKREEQ